MVTLSATMQFFENLCFKMAAVEISMVFSSHIPDSW